MTGQQHDLGHGITATVTEHADGGIEAQIQHLGVLVAINRQSTDEGAPGTPLRLGAFVWIDVDDADAVPDGELHVRLNDEPIADGPVR